MKDETSHGLIEALDQLLDRERKALLSGDLEQIGHLMPAKEDLVHRLNDLNTHQGEHLALVHEKVTRNQALLGSALDGIRAVANRMADLRKVRAGLEVYDRTGHKTNFSTSTLPSVEKRA
jgi:flagellar biosynthesis/type III secretory pathway chaperone